MFVAYGENTMRGARPKFREPEWDQVRDLVKIRREREARDTPKAAPTVEAPAKRKRVRVNKAKLAAAAARWERRKSIMAGKRRYDRIEAYACLLFDVKAADIKGKGRTAHIVFARQFIAYWVRRRIKTADGKPLSYPQIGRKMGGRDHTTSLHAARTYPKKRAKVGRKLREIG
jgi:chromosomal replication initiation ATPase DnaA